MLDDVLDNILKSANNYRLCTKCNEIKHKDEFYNSKRNYRCKKCEKIRYEKRKITKEYRDYKNNYTKKRIKTDEKFRLSLRYSQLKWKYKISKNDINLLLENQNFICRLCDKKVNVHSHLDHCHVTKRVRGFLCSSCNTKLGWYQKRVQLIQEYLK